MKKTVLAVALIALAATAGLALWPEDPVAARWQDYLARLERLTRQPVPSAAALELRPYPGNAALRRPLPDLRTGLLNYLGLRHCDLMSLVSERNSALGKLRSASLRLDYELTFIQRGERCLAEAKLEDTALIALLERTLAVKRDSLGDLFWNATWASDELRGFLNQSPGPAGDSARGLEALDGLASAGRALRESPPPDALPDLERHLATLAGGAAGGAVLREIAAARVALAQALGMLESLDEDSLCPRGRASQRARHLRNLLDSVYGQEVQPYLADLDRRQRHLGERLRALRAASSGTNPALDRWLDHYFGPRGQSARLDQALRAHTERWQTVLGACGLMPGGG
ncbi:DUF3080 family protein [Alloalcanivorax venustensis]|uniref:DUF3080 family protein n=1 Tax=Alloalcanivorax venustensis TaxID=172371 RepID=UPI003C6B4324